MKHTFTASNGTVTVTTTDLGSFKTLEVETVDNTVKLAGVHVDALREYFRAEADERLERWRWPEHPDYVVYHWGQPATAGVVVVSETEMTPSRVIHRETDPRNPTPEYRAAAAYFDALPRLEPWHNAKAGEVWVMTLAEGPEFVARVDTDSGFPRFIDLDDDMSYGPKSGFTAGRRIYPEPSDD